MSIIIIDGTKLKKIKKIEKFLEKAESIKKEQESPKIKHFDIKSSENSEVKTFNPKSIVVENNENAFSILQKELKNKGYVQVMNIDMDKKTVKEEIVSIDEIIKK